MFSPINKDTIAETFTRAVFQKHKNARTVKCMYVIESIIEDDEYYMLDFANKPVIYVADNIYHLWLIVQPTLFTTTKVYDSEYIDNYISKYLEEQHRQPMLYEYVIDSVFDILFENNTIVMSPTNIMFMYARYTYPIMSLDDADANQTNSHDYVDVENIYTQFRQAVRRFAMLSSKAASDKHYTIDVFVHKNTTNLLASFDFSISNCFIVANNKYAAWLVVDALVENAVDLSKSLSELFDTFCQVRRRFRRHTGFLDDFVEYVINMVVVSEDFYYYINRLPFYIIETDLLIIDQ
jgi:hypothetical protein